MFQRGSFGGNAVVVVVALLVACGAWPAHMAQAADPGRLDTAAMVLYPADIDELGLGETCVASIMQFRAEMGEQEKQKAFITFNRVPRVEDEIDDLVGDGDMVSIFSMTNNQECEYLEGERNGDFYTIQTAVLEQQRRSGARTLFDLMSDDSVLQNDPDAAEWESMDAPELGDEADLDVKWNLHEGERDYFSEVVLTVRVDRLVGQVNLVSNGTGPVEPDIDPILEAGEILAERMEEGLKAKRMPANTLLWLADLDDEDGTLLSPLNPEYYVVYGGVPTFSVNTTANDLDVASQAAEDRGLVSRYTRNLVYEVNGELTGYVEVGYYQYHDARAAEDDLDARLAILTDANPDSEFDQLDLEWGDGSLALMATAENEDGGTDIWYHGYLLIDDEMAYVQVISFAGETDVEVFELLMEQQESCMESRTGCEDPIPAEDVFG